jgi:hypothetical protein
MEYVVAMGVYRVHIGSGAHTASCPMGTSGSFLGGNAAGA